MTIFSNSEKETYKIAKEMGERAKPGTIVSLSGELGTGKTVFTSGFAKGLCVEDVISSPTFTIVAEYEGGRIPLYHFDVYRIEGPDEFYESGLDEYLYSEGVCIIEWGDKIKEILPENTTRIEIKKDIEKGFDHRIIEVKE